MCPKVTPCTLEGCNRPVPDKWIINLLGLYDTCRMRGALPEAGGVMDQPLDLMYWFDVIDRIYEADRVAKAEQQQIEISRMRHG